MKKCFSLLLALVLALGLTTAALAAEVRPAVTVGDAVYEDITEVPIAKLYQLVNDGTVSPAETFHFRLEAVGVTDSTETLATMPMFGSGTSAQPYTFDIGFAEGEATADGEVNEAVLPLPTYTTVGIYTYKITEIVEDTARTAGVTYNTQPLFLKVTVLQAEDGMVRVAAIHLGTEDGDKQAHIVNTYSAGTLDVTKTVAGHLGDRTKDFRFTVTLTKQADLCMNSAIGLTVAGVEQRDFAPDWDANGVCTVSFTLKHGETASLTNLPYGMTYTVAEDDYTAEGYTTAKTGDSGTIAADAVTAAFTNTKGGTVDTGVLLDSAPYVMLLLLAAGGAVLFLRRRVHRS